MKAIKQSLVMAGLFVALNLLYAPAQLSAQTIQSLGGVVTAQPDSVVQVVADSYNLAPVDPADLQVGGTYWWVEPGGAAVPMPCPPQQDANAVIYAITGDGQQFLVDCTGGEAQVTARRLGLQAQTTSSDVAAAVNAQADVIAALIDQIQTKAEDQQFQVLARAAGMADSDISFPGGGDGDGGTNSFSPDYSSYAAPDYGTNLWIAQWGMAAGKVTGVASNTLADVQYEIQTNSDLTTTNWVSTGQFILGSEVTNWTTLIPIPVNLTQNCFFRLRSWQSSDGSGIPDWWELEYFGTTGIDPNAQDAAGDGWTIYQKFQMGLNPNVFYTPPAPQGLAASYSASTATATLNWLPSPGAVTGYILNTPGGTVTLSASTTSYADNDPTLVAGLVPSYAYYDSPASFQLEASYAGGNSAAASVNLAPNSSNITFIQGAGGSNYLAAWALPPGTAAIRLTREDGYEEYVYGSTAYNSSNDIPLSNFTNGLCYLPPALTISPLYNGGYYGWWWLQTVNSNGAATSTGNLFGRNLTGGSNNIMDYTSGILLNPPDLDGRVQLKQNLIFELRAAAMDGPLHFGIPTTNNYGLGPGGGGAGSYGGFGAYVGDYLYPTNYAYADCYQFANSSAVAGIFDPFLPFEENALFRNLVFALGDVDENGNLTTGAADDPTEEDGWGCNGDTILLERPLTYQCQASATSFPALLATSSTRWSFYDQSAPEADIMGVGLLSANLTAGTLTMSGSDHNWFGLPYVSATVAYVDYNNPAAPLVTNVVSAGGTLTFAGDDLYGVASDNYVDIYPETAQPQFQTVEYDFWKVLPVWDSVAGSYTYALPGNAAFSPTNASQLLLAGVGSRIQVAGYAKLAVQNGYSGVYGYLGQYFDQAYQIINGIVTTNTTGVLSPYGSFFATQPGPAALVTMPDPDTGARGTCTVYSVSVVIDRNQGSNMDLSFSGANATSANNPAQIWVNNDYDYSGASWNFGNDVQASWYYNDGYQGKIDSQRDLEDYFRLWICGMPALTNGNYQVTLSWANVSSGTPTINLFDTVETNGGIGYLTNLDTATAEAYNYGIWGENRRAIATISPSQPFTFPASYFTNAGDKHFLFDGVGTNGTGELMMTISQNGNTIAQTGVWLEMHDVKDFYERAVITNNISSSSISNWTSGIEVVQQATASALGDDNDLIVFVHGFNVDNVNWLFDSDTVFKRLYWAGYRGKFMSVDWPCGKVSLNPYAFNTSEVNAYKASASMKNYLNQLRSRFPNYRLNILAHSQGNAVVSEAIKQGAPFDTYILTQGAVPASSYDVNAPTDSTLLTAESSVSTPEWQQMGYHGVYTNLTGRIVNFYNEEDFALQTGTLLGGLFPVNWVKNQKSYKPSLFYSYNGTSSLYDSLLTSYTVTDTQESRANVSRSRTDAVGATAGLGGMIQSSIDLHSQFQFSDLLDEHSAQWTRPIQTSRPYYQQVLVSFQIQPAP